MPIRTYHELRRTFASALEGDGQATRDALAELEALFRSAVKEGKLEDFLHKDARRTIEAIACSPSSFVLAMLRWLPDDEYRDLSGAICYHIDVHYLRATNPVAFDLAKSESKQAQAVLLRLMGINACPAVSLGWLLSLASVHGGEEGVPALVEELMELHMEELPISTQKLLSSEKNPLVNLEVARQALERLRSYSEGLKGLPEARELAMSIQMRLMLGSIRRKRSKAIHGGADENSLLSQLFPTRRFKYANRTAVEIHHGDRTEEQTLTMAPLSIFWEPPISELTEPIAGSLRRESLMKRGKL